MGLRKFCAILLTLLLSVPAVEARNRKSDKLMKQGIAAESRQDWDQALDIYEQALAADPGDVSYQLAVKRMRFQAAQKHVDLGQKLRAQGDVEGALAAFQKAISKDPSSAVALQEWKRTSDMLEREKTSGVKLTGTERGLTPADRARKEADDRAATMLAPPELQPVVAVIPSLKMNNQPPKVLYDTLCKLAGINVIFDQQYTPQGRNLNVDFTNASVEQALDYLAVLTKTFWKPISPNAIFVTEDNVTKRREYEDNVVKVFYIQNATSVQEFQEIATAVRSLTEIRRVYTYNAQKAILMRGTPDQIALAEKLIHDIDKPKAEVVVDVLVMEASATKTRDLAAAIISGTKTGLNMPFSFTPRNGVTPTTSSGSSSTSGTTTTSTAIRLGQITSIDGRDYTTTLPGGLLNLVLSDSNTRVLQSPQVRASDGQKVTLRIGDKIPYATGSYQPTVGTVGVSSLVSTQFQYAEVGVNIDITPQVHGAEEVTLKLAVEISTVKDHVTIGGVDQPVIGQRRNEAELRLREGEVNILSGLSQDQDVRTNSGVPGLINIPILGRLLGSDHTEKTRSNLLIAIIPHIVRTPNYSDADLRAVASGTDQTFKVGYQSRQSATAPAPVKPAVPAPEVKPQEPKAPIPGVPNPNAPPKVSFLPPQVAASLSGAITVTLQLENMTDVFAASPLRLKFDPQILRLAEATAGEFLSRDGQQVNITRDIRNDAGEATVTVSRVAGASGLSGSGGLVSFTFFTIGKGNTTITIPELVLKSSQQQPITVTAPRLPVTVQ